MKKINLAISGCLGRMGQQLIKSSKINKDFKLASLTENKVINKKPITKELKLIIDKITEFFSPEYLKICIWLSLNIPIKKNWVETKKMNGNISKSKEGEFRNET